MLNSKSGVVIVAVLFIGLFALLGGFVTGQKLHNVLGTRTDCHEGRR